MKKRFLIVFALALIIFIPWRHTPRVSAQTPPVLAFYYAWFDEGTWRSGQSADIPAQPYRSADAATIARHVMQARDAGIDAFVQSWYGPQTENNQTETNFRILLDTAQQSGFYAAVDVEVLNSLLPNAASVQDALSVLLATHVNHPAYFRYNGKPVIFFWRQQRLSVETWAAIRQAVDPNHNTYWIAEGIDLSYQSVFDGDHLYSIAWAGDVAAELNKWHPRLQKIETTSGFEKLWVATVMPGYDDLNLHRSDSFRRDRNGGAFYRETWRAAQATNPDMIIITSFNEWLEGTQIEPSVTYGDFYLNLTRELINSFSVVQPTVAPSPTLVPLPTPTTQPSTPSPTPTPPNIAYTIKAGDTLLGIALAFGVALDDIFGANDFPVGAKNLTVGQKIIIPNTGKKGVTRWKILEYRHIPEHKL